MPCAVRRHEAGAWARRGRDAMAKKGGCEREVEPEQNGSGIVAEQSPGFTCKLETVEHRKRSPYVANTLASSLCLVGKRPSDPWTSRVPAQDSQFSQYRTVPELVRKNESARPSHESIQADAQFNKAG
eukprot:6060986-Pleurochrysis_carterae.AAC.1